MPELTPVDLLKTRPLEPRPRSNWANIISGAIAVLSLVCATAVLCITCQLYNFSADSRGTARLNPMLRELNFDIMPG
jgi:hypothetical protein